MANRKVSHFVLALALLASARAFPVSPFSFGMMGMGGLMGMPFAHGSTYSGGSFNAGNGAGSMPAPALAPADRLSAVQIRQTDPVTGAVLEGFKIDIKPVGLDSNMHSNMPGAGLHGGLGAVGVMSPGLMGGLGGMYGGLGAGVHGGLGLGLGLGHHMGPELQANIEIVLPAGIPSFRRFLVFLEFADVGVTNSANQCLPSEQGAVLTGQVSQNISPYGLGQYGGVGQNFGHGFGGALGMLGGHGHMMDGDMESQFGIVATLDIKGGPNSFEFKGLGPFFSIEQLAGHGVGICTEVEMAADMRPVCSDVGDIPISFCGNLAFNNEDSVLPAAVPAGGP